eukprot:1306063-Pyramimonas_sp.AAC.1
MQFLASTDSSTTAWGATAMPSLSSCAFTLCAASRRRALWRSTIRASAPRGRRLSRMPRRPAHADDSSESNAPPLSLVSTRI